MVLANPKFMEETYFVSPKYIKKLKSSRGRGSCQPEFDRKDFLEDWLNANSIFPCYEKGYVRYLIQSKNKTIIGVQTRIVNPNGVLVDDLWEGDYRRIAKVRCNPKLGAFDFMRVLMKDFGYTHSRRLDNSLLDLLEKSRGYFR